MYSMFGSTIAAISTARGKGGIAVIRISGDDAITICEKFIFPKNEAVPWFFPIDLPFGGGKI